MTTLYELSTILKRITEGSQTDAGIAALRQLLSTSSSQNLSQLGRYNINSREDQDIHIGDRHYLTWNDEAIQALVEVVQKLQSTTQSPTLQLASVNELVQ